VSGVTRELRHLSLLTTLRNTDWHHMQLVTALARLVMTISLVKASGSAASLILLYNGEARNFLPTLLLPTFAGPESMMALGLSVRT
jgi:hypothetical protein